MYKISENPLSLTHVNEGGGRGKLSSSDYFL